MWTSAMVFIGDLVLGGAAHQADPLALTEHAVHDTDVDDDPLEGVEMAVIDERLERSVRVAGRCRDALDDRPEQLVDTEPGLAADAQHLGARNADGLLHLGDDLVGPGGGEVDLVEDRQDCQVVLHREVGIGDGLGLHALAGIDEQDGALAGSEAARHFVAEIDVPWRVDQVQLVAFAFVGVVNRDGVHADGDAAFAFEIHRVEDLGAKVALADRSGLEQQLVRQCGFAVVDVGNDAEIADVLCLSHLCSCRGDPLGPARRAAGVHRSTYGRSFLLSVPVERNRG
jgi:hypothetical protein